MSMISDLTSGAAGGVFTGIGQLAKDIRAAVTGKETISAADANRMIELAQSLELEALKADQQVALAQAQINLADANSGSSFRGGWRPMAGWVCVTGLAYQIGLRPFLVWGSINFELLPPPELDMQTLSVLLGGLLGLGGFRTFERVRGMRK